MSDGTLSTALLRHASTQNVSEKESKLKCIQPPQGGHGYGYGCAVLCSVTNFQLRKPHDVRYQVRRISHNGLDRLWLQDVEALTGSQQRPLVHRVPHPRCFTSLVFSFRKYRNSPSKPFLEIGCKYFARYLRTFASGGTCRVPFSHCLFCSTPFRIALFVISFGTAPSCYLLVVLSLDTYWYYSLLISFGTT